MTVYVHGAVSIGKTIIYRNARQNNGDKMQNWQNLDKRGKRKKMFW